MKSILFSLFVVSFLIIVGCDDSESRWEGELMKAGLHEAGMCQPSEIECNVDFMLIQCQEDGEGWVVVGDCK